MYNGGLSGYPGISGPPGGVSGLPGYGPSYGLSPQPAASNIRPFPKKTFRLFGWLISILATASLTIEVANTTYVYTNFGGQVTGGSCPLTYNSICPIIYSYVSVGIWASIPIFIAGIVALKIGQNPTKLRNTLQTLCFVSAILFAPAIAAFSAFEIYLWNGSTMNTITSGASGLVVNNPVKFAFSLVDAILGAVEFFLCGLAALYFFRNRKALKAYENMPYGMTQSGYGATRYAPGNDTLPPIYLPADDDQFPPDQSQSQPQPAPQPTSTNNNNNNNVVIPPIIMQSPAPANPYPIYLPSPQPIIIQEPAPAAPQPIYIPYPLGRRPPFSRPILKPPPPRPVLAPLPPSRYYAANSRLPPIRRYAGPSYLADPASPFVGKPWSMMQPY